ncbi:hypothetical protein LZ519_03395 [Sphingomonas sp. RG327]|uniref:Uncharacterized protein n=1 Tax=Sphingomonas anseongensis TaxID=2908207 RepID=A0ABT0RDP3_9SPHN|nr:hypothetical protein [Sphingomonas anseongensis]MCL6678363.1 hypothetical protein [Sphingomonas anseongensis]
MATQRFSVEFERRTVGIAVRVPGGFVFYASDSRFEGLDGKTFPRARTIERELAKFAKQQKPARQTLQQSPAMA